MVRDCRCVVWQSNRKWYCTAATLRPGGIKNDQTIIPIGLHSYIWQVTVPRGRGSIKYTINEELVDGNYGLIIWPPVNKPVFWGTTVIFCRPIVPIVGGNSTCRPTSQCRV